jgi:hypothetical protein
MSENNNDGTGIGIGGVIAILISWHLNHSIIWCIIHGLFGWLYVIYVLIFKGGI